MISPSGGTAKGDCFIIVTKDSDFHEFSLLFGNPPKAIWLKCGNKPKWYVLDLLLNNRDKIEAFYEDEGSRLKPALTIALVILPIHHPGACISCSHGSALST